MPLTLGADVGNIFVEDAGDYPSFDSPDDVPYEDAQAQDSLTARRFTTSWTANYELSTIRDDSQLSSITISGAARGFNCRVMPERPTRATLTYSVSSVGSDHTVRFWNGVNLVAEGTRTGNGAVTCSPVNGSGLTVAATLTFSTDLTQDIAQIEVRWPAAYQIHYSTSSLSFPRTPEATVNDNGGIRFTFQSPLLSNGSYNYNVLAVDDEGNVETSPPTPGDSPLVINAAPDATAGVVVSIVTISGKKYVQVNWTADSSSHDIYLSEQPNAPINFGAAYNVASGTSVKQVATIKPDTAVGLPQLDPAAVDREPAFDAITTAFDDVADDLNSAWAVDVPTFTAALATAQNDLDDALLTYGSITSGIGLDTLEFRDSIDAQFSTIAATADGFADLDLTDFQAAIYGNFSALLAYLGTVLEGSSGRYPMPDGTTGSVQPVSETLWDAAQPFVIPAVFRLVIRATAGGVQETTDQEHQFEIDPSGAIVNPRPPDAHISNVDISSTYTLTATAEISLDDADAMPTAIDFYVVSHGGTITESSPSASVSLPSPDGSGFFLKTVSYIVGGNGHYDLAVKSRAADGTRSANLNRLALFVSNVEPFRARHAGKVLSRSHANEVAWETPSRSLE